MRLHQILFQTDAESFSFLSEQEKSFIPKNISFRPKEIRKMAFAVLIFSEGFLKNNAFFQDRKLKLSASV